MSDASASPVLQGDGSKPAPFARVTGCMYAVTSDRPYLFCNVPVALPGEIDENIRKTAPRYCAGHAVKVVAQPLDGSRARGSMAYPRRRIIR